MNIGSVIKKYRKASGFTQEEMAEKYLNYFSDYNPMKKLKLGQLYMEQEKTEEAYENVLKLNT